MTKENSLDLTDFSDSQLKRIFAEVGLKGQHAESAIADYRRYRDSEVYALHLLTGKQWMDIDIPTIAQTLKSRSVLIGEVFVNYIRYLDYKTKIAETYQESKDWKLIFSKHVLIDVDEAQEAFIDYVEEVYQTRVTDAKHLQELTGITHLYSYDEQQKGHKEVGDKEAEENALRELQETLIGARHARFFRALEKALAQGAKYKDLLNIKPQDYGLSNDFKRASRVGANQYNSILWAISFEFMINEPGDLMLLPDLRSIAQEIEAPYSVVMDCYKLFNFKEAPPEHYENEILYNTPIEEIKDFINTRLLDKKKTGVVYKEWSKVISSVVFGEAQIAHTKVRGKDMLTMEYKNSVEKGEAEINKLDLRNLLLLIISKHNGSTRN